MKTWIASAVVVLALGAMSWFLPDLRRSLIHAVTKYDATPSEPPPLPAGTGSGLAPAPRTRVVLIDGLAEDVTPALPMWTALCKRGVTMRVDVGFPTVSLPVEVALWSGLTQQQTGIVYRYNRPLDPPLDKRGIPAQIAGSIAIAEGVELKRGDQTVPGHYGWIVRSLGFSHTEPAADPTNPLHDANAEAWNKQWEARARAAVSSDSRLVFVHVLRVDVAGHAHGLTDEYRRIAAEADAILGGLVASEPNARWFVISDHGHIPRGGHGGEERAVRQVQGCVAGPGIEVARGELVHLVDIARAIADSTGAVLDRESRGRPLAAALSAPLHHDVAVPALPLGSGAGAIFIIVAGLALATWGVRRWWLAPWWFVSACLALVLVRGEPTLSMGMVYHPEGRDMYLVWLPILPLAIVATFIGLGTTTLARVLVAQLAIPFAAVAAAITATGAWPAVFGDDVAPVVPRYTAYMSPLLLMAAQGALAVALAVLARLVRPRSDRREPPALLRSAPAAAASGPATDPPDRPG